MGSAVFLYIEKANGLNVSRFFDRNKTGQVGGSGFFIDRMKVFL